MGRSGFLADRNFLKDWAADLRPGGPQAAESISCCPGKSGGRGCAGKSQCVCLGCSFYKILWLFVIGAFLGDLVETVFCRVTAGVWMSRSSVVWGPFSLVWGIAIAAATLLLHKYRDRSDRFVFIAGTCLGGAYEYICSVVLELLFGKVFWDYSKIPFNLGGRVNLLYCFFWGIAAIVWIKGLYPVISSWIEKIPLKQGKSVLVDDRIFLLQYSCILYGAAAKRSEGAGHAGRTDMAEGYGRGV